ncbi:DUF2680 domain-containing protein [Alkalihalobacillus deserti]|uniref:DUF2680 domain-containing protein n=1 Tax=Alkalihalobacillus deserti TaxID=2879466 RepID=UPI001D137E1C|nr:DUF2680 domain-containing protein [Alkalihalobacillus deserti]
MNKWFLAFAMMLAVIVMPNYIQAEEVNEKVTTELTEEQKGEMAKLHMEVLEKKKEVVAKYVEFGIFSPEKAEKINAMFDKHYQKLEENKFIPKWDGKRKHKGH